MHEKFVRKSFSAAFSSYFLALAKNSYEKVARKMLMKSTPNFPHFIIFFFAAKLFPSSKVLGF